MEQKKKREMELNIKDLGTVLLRCWWIMLVIGILVGGAVYLLLRLTRTDEYTATASIYVMREAVTKTSGTDKTQLQTGDVSISNNLKADVMSIPFRHRVIDPVLEADGKEVSEANYKKMKKAITTESEEDEHIVYISATAESPEHAVVLANLLVEQTCKIFNDELFENEKYLKPLDRAVMPEKPSNPISIVLILLVTVGTMLVVYLVFFILFLSDDKINDGEDVQNYLGVSLLGQIPNRRDTSRRRKKYGGYYSYESHGAKTATENGQKGDAAK
jgi:capsular polysaccharide biosynthesis protein